MFMTKYQIDLIYDKQSGQVEFLIDILDPSRTALDIQEGIENGSLEQEVLEHIEANWGKELADQVRSGAVRMKCTDTSLNERMEVKALLERHPIKENNNSRETASQDRENEEPQRERLR